MIIRHGLSNTEELEENKHMLPRNGLIPLVFYPPINATTIGIEVSFISCNDFFLQSLVPHTRFKTFKELNYFLIDRCHLVIVVFLIFFLLLTRSTRLVYFRLHCLRPFNGQNGIPSCTVENSNCSVWIDVKVSTAIIIFLGYFWKKNLQLFRKIFTTNKITALKNNNNNNTL